MNDINVIAGVIVGAVLAVVLIWLGRLTVGKKLY